jgi:hypothetical protein
VDEAVQFLLIELTEAEKDAVRETAAGDLT